MPRVIARVLAALLLVVLALPLIWKLTTGDFYLTVTGRSMSPTLEIGDLLVVRQPTGDELTRVGTIVVVTLNSGAEGATRYVHRVVEPVEGGAWLRGDANDGRDPRPVSQDAVLGTPRAVLAGDAARAFEFVRSVPGRIVLGGVALGLLMLPVGRRPAHPAHSPRREDLP